MMVNARKDHEQEPVANNAAGDLSRLSEATSKLFAEQAAAMAMMTTYGMTVAAQMTGMMLGALRGPAAAEAAEVARPAEPTSAPPESPPTGKVVELRPHAPKGSGVAARSSSAVIEKPARKVAKPAKAKAVTPSIPAAKPARMARATAAKSMDAIPDGDDLKKISGIGPRLESELNARGILRYADIAALSKAAVKKLDTELGLEGRIARDDWAGQARSLSGGKG